MSLVGNIVSRVNNLDRRRRLLVMGLSGLLVLVIVLAAVSLLYRPQLSDSEQRAVNEAAKAASGFDKGSDGYSFTQLNKAVEFAAAKKCTEARAVYDEAAGRANGMPASDVAAYKKRIEDLCSGNTTPPPQNNPF